MRLIFMGTPDFAVPTLRHIYDSGLYNIVGVFSQKPRKAGRGGKLTKQPIHLLAEQYSLPIFTPEKLKNNADSINIIKNLKPDIIVVVAYGLILPKEVLNIPTLACINVHASLLPRWRGASPIHSAILNGDKKTGISIMKMDPGLDSGPVILEKSIPIMDYDTAGILHDKLANMGGNMINEAIQNFKKLYATSSPQNKANVTYAPKLSRKIGRIDWTKTALEIKRQIKAFSPWPGSTTVYNNEIFHIHDAAIISPKIHDEISLPGTIIDDNLTVKTGDGYLQIEKIQRSGKKILNREEFMRGSSLTKGLKFDQ